MKKSKALQGKKSFYSKKLEKVILCKDGFYDVKNKEEYAEVEKYLKGNAPKKIHLDNGASKVEDEKPKIPQSVTKE